MTNAGHVLIHQPIVVGGASLELHWGRAAAHEQDPQGTNGLYGKQSLKQHLTAQPWDFVTIQQASIKSHDVETYRPFAKQLHDYIKQHAPKSEVLMHQTWAYRVDDPRFSPTTPKAGEPATQAQMYEQLTRAYTTIAAELGETSKGSDHYQVLFLIGVLLFSITFIVNLAADLVVARSVPLRVEHAMVLEAWQASALGGAGIPVVADISVAVGFGKSRTVSWRSPFSVSPSGLPS